MAAELFAVSVIAAGLVIAFLVLLAITSIATLFLFMGPPDTFDVDIQGEIKKKDKEK